ncbi:MAG: hypothetical protein ACREC0_14015 [Methylocella sp.]
MCQASAFNPKSALGFWLPPRRWAEGEFPAHFPSLGNARNAPNLAMTAAALGAGVLGHFGQGSARPGQGGA